jgi:hypothetical protein
MAARKLASLGQGVDEAIRYEIDATPAPVTVTAVTVYDETEGEDVSGDVLQGSAAIQEGRLVLPLLTNLVARHVYRVEVQYSDGVSTLEPWFAVVGER